MFVVVIDQCTWQCMVWIVLLVQIVSVRKYLLFCSPFLVERT